MGVDFSFEQRLGGSNIQLVEGACDCEMNRGRRIFFAELLEKRIPRLGGCFVAECMSAGQRIRRVLFQLLPVLLEGDNPAVDKSILEIFVNHLVAWGGHSVHRLIQCFPTKYRKQGRLQNEAECQQAKNGS